MNSTILSVGILGIDTYPVEVQVDAASGIPKFEIVGLPESSVKEGKSRIDSALRNSGFDFRHKLNVRVNLSPAALRKTGSLYDLPIAIGILASRGLITRETNGNMMIAGELSLDGRIKPIKGALMILTKAGELGIKEVILPKANLNELIGVNGVKVYGVENLCEAYQFINGEKELEAASLNETQSDWEEDFDFDFAEVKGQEGVKRAVTVAVSGGHNILMVGPPGSGKSMIAKRIPTILPKMTYEERLETTKLYNSIGKVPKGGGLFKQRPFRSPHHTVSDAGMVGGNRIPRPGEMSLAHNGVLFLDEFSEFKKHVLEVMRQPLEDGHVSISRAMGSVKFPCRTVLVAAMNPCPCGYLGDKQRICECSNADLSKHLKKISNPIFDRIDIHIEVPRVDFQSLSSKSRGLSSPQIKKKVLTAMEIQQKRYKGRETVFNSQMPDGLLDEFCALDDRGKNLLESAMTKFSLSARAYSKILKVSRTIADIEGSESIMSAHLAEAVHYRSLDRRFKF